MEWVTNFFKKSALFAGLFDNDLETLVQMSEAGTAKRRHLFYTPEDPSDGVYWIKSGRVKIYHLTEDGREVILCMYNAGDIFGEMAFLEDGFREYFAEAIERVSYVFMPRRNLFTLAKRKPALIYRYAKLIGERRRETETGYSSLMYKGVRKRLAWQLLKLAGQYGIQDNRGKLLTVKITHKELACLIGSSRETVSLTLGELKDMGLLEINSDRKFIIKDTEHLSRLA